MLGIGMQEILIILVVALIVIGPKRLPDLARTLGKGFAEFRKAADDLQETVRMDLQREKQEEFRQKYPHMVPDEDDSGEETATETGTGREEEKGGTASAAAGSTVTEPEPPSPPHAPEETAKGDEAEDDHRNG